MKLDLLSHAYESDIILTSCSYSSQVWFLKCAFGNSVSVLPALNIHTTPYDFFMTRVVFIHMTHANQQA